MTTAAVLAQGTTFTIKSSIGTPTTVGEVISFAFKDAESTQIDATSLASTAKEFKIGLQDFGTLTLELIKLPDDAGQIVLLEAKAAQAVRDCVLTLPSGTNNVYSFTGLVTSFDFQGGVDGILTGTCVIKISGAVTPS